MGLHNLLGFKKKVGGNIRWMLNRSAASSWFLIPYFTPMKRRAIVDTGDPVRYGSIELALEQVMKDQVRGSLAECGVYKGTLSKFIHDRVPDRRLFLFDTFSGFDSRDSGTLNDTRFRDTSAKDVLDHIGDTRNIIVRKGYFPETVIGLEEERFALVMIDFDKYEPTAAALQFFYPRTEPGGFIFIHDYTSPESDWACSRAVDEYLHNKPESPILIPDGWGTALFRKV